MPRSCARAARRERQSTAQSNLTVRRRQIDFINANIAARGHASILSDSPLVTIWAAKAGRRRSSYTVRGSGAVISQAASRYRCGHEPEEIGVLIQVGEGARRHASGVFF